MNSTSRTGDLHLATVQILTTAARRQRADGTQRDFADFLAQVLASTAANLGGPEQLLAGRSGSWEASLVESLLQGTMSDDPALWLHFRTEPIVVPLNVAELVENPYDHPGLLHLDDALAGCDERHEHDDDEGLGGYEHELSVIATRYVQEFALYGERFTSAVRAAAAEIDGLTVPVRVHVDADPLSEWWTDRATNNPSPYDDDELVVQLWQVAHDSVPLPNVDIRPISELSDIDAGSSSRTRGH